MENEVNRWTKKIHLWCSVEISENILPVENSVRVMGPHEKIFPDEKLCLMSVLNGLSLCLLDFELVPPPKKTAP